MSNSGRKRKASLSSNTSPSKKAKLAEGLLDDPDVYDIHFQPGQITRINLTNWVTFDQTEIKCDPGLNLIVGPNGTGKSSVVCAICLGLGGKPKSLGRGDKAADFIKFGRKQAKIEIELFAKNRHNDIIIRYITQKGSTWSLNKKKCNAKTVEEFVKNKRNIKVDNLCQFLAQDRVSAFASLSPKDLLLETEKAIEDNQLYAWHKFLMDKGEKADTDQKEIDNLTQTLGQNIAEKKSLSKTIEQFEVKKKMEEEAENYRALREWTLVKQQWKEFKRKQKHTEKLKKEFEKKKANIGPMKKASTQWNRKLQTAQNRYNNHLKDIKKVDRRRMSAHKKLTNIKHLIENYEDKIQQAVQDYKTKAKTIKRYETDIAKVEAQLEGFNEEEIDAAKKERQRITQCELRELRKERNKFEQQLKYVNNQKGNIEHNLHGVVQQLEKMQNVSKTKEAHIFNSKRMKEKNFKHWVDGHRHEFTGQVYGPIVKEMTVKDDLHARYLNNCIGPAVFYGYVCERSEDWQRLLRKSQEMKLMCTIYKAAEEKSNNGYIRRPIDKDTLRRSGVDGYLDEVFDAPDIIKKTLNDVCGLHMRAYAMNDIDSGRLDNVLLTRKGQSGRLRSLITPRSIYNIKESHYTNNVMRGMQGLKRFSFEILVKTPDFSQQIYEMEQEEKDLHQKLDNIEQEKKQVDYNRKQIYGKMQRLQEKKQELEMKIKEYKKLKTRLDNKKKNLKELEAEQDDPEEVRERFTLSIGKKNNERIKIFEQLAKDIELEKNLMKKSNGYEISKKYYSEEYSFANRKIKVIQDRNKTLRKEFDGSIREQKKLYQSYERAIQSACHNYPRQNYIDEWSDEDKTLSVDAIENKINHLQGRINVLLIDEGRVERYNRLMRKIEVQTKKLEILQRNQATKNDAIKDVENKWKPKLLEAVEKISSKFSEFFAQFNKAQGKVELVCNDLETKEELKYSDWCIDILTKFRPDPNVPWKRLTSSSQSGGEKSVSTMLYLLSLQQVTTVPFRVVDEINQGMDPINERRIMKILNYECTPKKSNNNGINIRQLPQYFVVTPKLLPKLQYSPCSSVYVIFNGPWQMAHKQWQMDKFIQSQKELTNSGFINNRNNNNNNEEEESDDDEEDEEDEEEEEESD